MDLHSRHLQQLTVSLEKSAVLHKKLEEWKSSKQQILEEQEALRLAEEEKMKEITESIQSKIQLARAIRKQKIVAFRSDKEKRLEEKKMEELRREEMKQLELVKLNEVIEWVWNERGELWIAATNIFLNLLQYNKNRVMHRKMMMEQKEADRDEKGRRERERLDKIQQDLARLRASVAVVIESDWNRILKDTESVKNGKEFVPDLPVSKMDMKSLLLKKS